MLRVSSQWVRTIIACAVCVACGRIGYQPWDGTDLPAPDVPGGSRGPDAASVMDATVAVIGTDAAPAEAGGPDVASAMDVVATASDATDVDVGAPSPDTGTDAAESGVQYPVCAAPCCCAYTCTYNVAPSASVCAGGASDPAKFNFESGIQGWAVSDAANTAIPGQVSVSTTESFAGLASLEATLNIPAGSVRYVRVNSGPALAPGDVVTFHVWVPPGAGLTNVQPYVMDANYTWTDNWVWTYDLVPGCWATIQVTVPATFVTPFFEVGVQFGAPSGAPYSGVAYIDSVSW